MESRFPVVLPCGHTYVCNQCAERLDKCMECRTSLVQIIPRTPEDLGQSGRGGGRWSSSARPAGSRSPGAPPVPPIKKRLPLPKNVVLMSLIEATELAAENVRSQEQHPSLEESPNLGITDAILDLDEEEEEKIRTGTNLAISECGTYAIAAKNGLEIYPSRPGSSTPAGHEQGKEDEEVDTLVRFFHLDHKLEIGQSKTQEEDHSTELEYKENAPAKLRWGDRVQIVSTEAGWAKLARGYGFVRADKNQLVKGRWIKMIRGLCIFLCIRNSTNLFPLPVVGSSVDRACKLEALLRLLSTRRKELRSEQKKIDNQFISLMNELQVSLMSDEDLTVIAADAFKKKQSDDIMEEIEMDKIDLEQPLSQEVRMDEKFDQDSTPLKPRPMERPMTPPHAIESSRGFFCTSGDMFDAVIPMSSGASRPRAPLPSATQTPAIVEHLAQTNSNLSTSTTDSTPTPRIFASASNPSPNALRAGARAWREIHGQPYGEVLGGVDFRTGMSGHTALNRTVSSHPHDYLNPRGTVNFRGGFSNHSGLTMWKKKSTSSSRGATSSMAHHHLAMPMFPAGPEPATHHHKP